ncbi:MAG: extracellular solute-binding protein [Lachnospiraceae bacterium]|nr:extracellular solute-binding protein [Lachnospiraceae bacterium]
MKKRLDLRFIIWLAMVLFLLAGCQKTPKAEKDPLAPGVNVAEESLEEFEILEEVSNAAMDNTLDAYMAVARRSLIISADDKADGEKYVWPVGSAIGKSQGVYCGGHIYDALEKSWYELYVARDSGDDIREKCMYLDGKKMNVLKIGSVWGSNDVLLFVAEPVDDGSHRLSFLETDETMQNIRETEVKFLVNDEIRYQFADRCKKDSDGRIHLITNMLTKDPNDEVIPWQYCVMDEVGNMLFEWQDEGLWAPELSFDTEGNVVLLTRTYHLGRVMPEDRHYLLRWDADEGGVKTLTEIPVTDENQEWFFAMPKEGVVLTANGKGIYRTAGEMEEELYVWSKHGISVSYVHELQQTKDGRIQVIYESDGTYWYVSLEETGEKREITEVELAVSPNMKEVYQSAANEFNKRFPTYHVSVRDDYDEKLLLTKLIAGDGPILIDTYLTGFEEQEKLWMPLDNLFTQLGLDGELVEDAMKAGEINGRLYGVVSNFWIQTVITKAKKSGHWDYEEFLSLVREKPVSAIADYQPGDRGLSLFSDILNHGMEDNYFLSSELGGESFETREFQELLDLAEKYYTSDELWPEDEMLWPEGGVLCHRVAITKPEDLEAFRLFYGEDAYFAGYPSNEGSGHYLCSISPLTVRNTAGVKEKAAALAFLKYLLSEEVQKLASKNLNFRFSVRKDVLKDQIRGMDGGTKIYKSGYSYIKIPENLDYERDEQIFYDLLEHSTPQKPMPKELRNILYGELREYLGGGITRDALVDHLKNRVGLWLHENIQ